MSFSSTERARLASLLLELGPDAPTLCEGWDTRALAAHLWVRERRPVAAAGMFVPALAPMLKRDMAAARARDYEQLVMEWGSGPTNPVARLVDRKINAAEHFVHLEDVRRANGMTQPREFSQVTQDAMEGICSMLAPRILRKSEAPVILFPKGRARIVAVDRHGVSKDGGNVVRVMGTVPELLLWLYGRSPVEVKVEGPADKVVRSSI